MYNRNNYVFDKNEIKRPGYNTGLVKVEQKRESPAENDRKNRLNILKQIEKAINEGKTLDDVLEILATNEEINNQFRYLTKNGIDLKNVFKAWYEASQRNKDRKYNIFFEKGE